MPVASAAFTGVDLSRLPAPQAIEELGYEPLRAEWLAGLQALYPAFDATVESDPIVKLCEAAAYREMTWRAARNAGLRSVMVAYAQGSDLDALGALFGVERYILVPADPLTATPAMLEADDEFRRRLVLAPEGYSVAGPAGAYIFHALSADGNILDVAADSPTRGEVVVTVLSRSGDGTAGPDLLAAVEAALGAETIRPITDHVVVQSATIVAYEVEATLTFFAGPDKSVVLAAAQAALDRRIAAAHRIGAVVTRASLIAALMQPGVQNVDLTVPADDLDPGAEGAPACSGITLIDGGLAG